MKKFFKVFKAGKYPQGEISENDIKEIALNYNPEYHEAPLTVNHDDNGAAYASVDEVRADGKDLLVSFKDILDEAYDINKKYKKPSVEIAEYEGKKYLRAVTLTNFPQVKGLDRIQFGENSTFYFNEDLSINLVKGINMETKKFSDKILKLAETLSINYSNYQVEEDIIDAAIAKCSELKSQIGESSQKVTSLNMNLSKFNDAGITVEKFNEILKEKDEAIMAKTELELKIKEFNENRIEDLITYAITIKDFLPAQVEQIRKFAQIDFNAAKDFVYGFKTKSNNKPLQKIKPDGKEYTYEDILKDSSLVNKFSEEEINELRKQSKLFS